MWVTGRQFLPSGSRGGTWWSNDARERAAVDEQALAGDVAGAVRAEEGAGGAELVGAAEAPGGDAVLAVLADVRDAAAGALGGDAHQAGDAVGIEGAGEQVV